MERFFQLAKGPSGPAGWVGQITGKAFTMREFGTKIIEDFLVHKDLQLVADASLAYVPGHGTPTIKIISRNREPSSTSVRAVLGIRGEPTQPLEPANNFVRQEMTSHLSDEFDGTYVTITDLNRSALVSHPGRYLGVDRTHYLTVLR